jgi:hypothetical protein
MLDELVRQCFETLRVSLNNSPSNQLYVSDRFKVLLAYADGSTDVGHNQRPEGHNANGAGSTDPSDKASGSSGEFAMRCITEMLNNREIQETKVSKGEMDLFVQVLRRTHNNYMVLKLLAAFCTCQGSAVSKNQTLLGRMLLDQHMVTVRSEDQVVSSTNNMGLPTNFAPSHTAPGGTGQIKKRELAVDASNHKPSLASFGGTRTQLTKEMALESKGMAKALKPPVASPSAGSLFGKLRQHANVIGKEEINRKVNAGDTHSLTETMRHSTAKQSHIALINMFRPEKRSTLLVSIEFTDGGVRFVYPEASQHTGPPAAGQLLKPTDFQVKSRRRQQQQKFLQQQLYLLADLCCERNYSTIAKVRRLVPFTTIIHCISPETGLSPSLRSAFIKLASSLYVDVDPQLPRNWNNLTFCFHSIEGDGLATKSSGPTKANNKTPTAVATSLVKPGAKGDSNYIERLQALLEVELTDVRWNAPKQQFVVLLLQLIDFDFYQACPWKLSKVHDIVLNALQREWAAIEIEKAVQRIMEKRLKISLHKEKEKHMSHKKGVMGLGGLGKKLLKGGASTVQPTDEGDEDFEEDWDDFEEEERKQSAWFSSKCIKEGLFPTKARKKMLRALDNWRTMIFVIFLVFAAVGVGFAAPDEPIICDSSVGLTGECAVVAAGSGICYEGSMCRAALTAPEGFCSGSRKECTIGPVAPSFFVIFDMLCFVIFAMELVLRMWAVCDMAVFFSNPFSAMDFLVVSLDVSVMVLKDSMPDTGGGTKALRMIRLARLARLLKVMRLMKKMRDELMKQKEVPVWKLPNKFRKGKKEKFAAMTSMARVMSRTAYLAGQYKLKLVLAEIKKHETTMQAEVPFRTSMFAEVDAAQLPLNMRASTHSYALSASFQARNAIAPPADAEAEEDASAVVPGDVSFDERTAAKTSTVKERKELLDTTVLHLIFYEHQPLVQEAVNLLMVMHTQQSRLVHNVLNAQLLCSVADEKLFDMVRTATLRITQMMAKFSYEVVYEDAKWELLKDTFLAIESACQAEDPRWVLGTDRYRPVHAVQTMLRNLELDNAYRKWRQAVDHMLVELFEQEQELRRQTEAAEAAEQALPPWSKEEEKKEEAKNSNAETTDTAQLSQSVSKTRKRTREVCLLMNRVLVAFMRRNPENQMRVYHMLPLIMRDIKLRVLGVPGVVYHMLFNNHNLIRLLPYDFIDFIMQTAQDEVDAQLLASLEVMLSFGNKPNKMAQVKISRFLTDRNDGLKNGKEVAGSKKKSSKKMVRKSSNINAIAVFASMNSGGVLFSKSGSVLQKTMKHLANIVLMLEDQARSPAPAPEPVQPKASAPKAGEEDDNPHFEDPLEPVITRRRVSLFLPGDYTLRRPEDPTMQRQRQALNPHSDAHPDMSQPVHQSSAGFDAVQDSDDKHEAPKGGAGGKEEEEQQQQQQQPEEREQEQEEGEEEDDEEEEEEEEQSDLMVETDISHLMPQMQYMLVVLQLLSTCAAGATNIVEAKIQGSIDTQELLDLIVHEHTPAEIRHSVSRIFFEAVVEVQIPTEALGKNLKMWKWLHTFPDTLEIARKFMESYKHRRKMQKRHIQERVQAKETGAPPPATRASMDSGDFDTQACRRTMTYAFEVLLPTISHFFQLYYPNLKPRDVPPSVGSPLSKSGLLCRMLEKVTALHDLAIELELPHAETASEATEKLSIFTIKKGETEEQATIRIQREGGNILQGKSAGKQDNKKDPEKDARGRGRGAGLRRSKSRAEGERRPSDHGSPSPQILRRGVSNASALNPLSPAVPPPRVLGGPLQPSHSRLLKPLDAAKRQMMRGRSNVEDADGDLALPPHLRVADDMDDEDEELTSTGGRKRRRQRQGGVVRNSERRYSLQQLELDYEAAGVTAKVEDDEVATLGVVNMESELKQWRLQQKLLVLANEPAVKKHAKSGMIELLNTLSDMPRLDEFVEDWHTAKIGILRFEPLLCKLVQHTRGNVQLSGDRKVIAPELVDSTVWVLQLLRRLVEHLWGFGIERRDEWGDEASDANVEEVQDALNDAQAPQLCIDLIAKGMAVEVVLEANRLLVAMLYREGGNVRVQETMNRYLAESNSEMFFVEVIDTFARIGVWHANRSAALFGQMMSGDSSATGVQSDAAVSDPRAQSPDLLLLQMLQLACEGHYRPNQDILRAQPRNERSVNVLDYMVNTLVELGRSFDDGENPNPDDSPSANDSCSNTWAAVPGAGANFSKLEAVQLVCKLVLEVTQGPATLNQEHFAQQTELLETLNRMMRIEPLTSARADTLAKREEEIEMGRSYRRRGWERERDALEEELAARYSEALNELKATLLRIFRALLEGQGNGQASLIYDRMLSVLHLEVSVVDRRATRK